MSGSRAAEFERVLRAGGVALFPTDTVYGLACDPGNAAAVARLYALKGRPAAKPSALMYFDRELALGALPPQGQRTQRALTRLLPGPVTVLLDGGIGVRVVDVESLRGVSVPVLQSSANRAGGPDAATLDQVPQEIRAAVDLEIDGGPLPGVPSTVLDLRGYERDGRWSVLRYGPVGSELAEALDGRFHFHPDGYAQLVSRDLPDYDELQAQLVRASGAGARRILDLGAGAGETAIRLLRRHSDAAIVAVDESEEMLSVARERLGTRLERAHRAMLQDALPSGPFDLVASALAIHHLDGAEKADLFTRIRRVLAPGGRLVLADVVVPEDPAQAVTELTPGYDKPSTVAEQLRWMADAGFWAAVAWSKDDLAVIVAE